MSADRRRLWSLALPNLVSMGSLTLLAVVNAAWVGRLGTAELGSIGIATTWVYLVVAFPIGLLNSVRTPVAVRTGAGDAAGAERATRQGLWVALACSVLALPFAGAGDVVFGWLGASPEVAGSAADYARWRLLGAPLLFAVTALGAGFHGRGDSRTPMVANVVANLVNAVSDPFLVYGWGPAPSLGTAGAAIGLDLGYAVALAILAWRSAQVLGRAGSWGPDRAGLRAIWGVGAPSALQFLLDVGSFVGFQALLAGSGDAALAANVVTARIVMMSFLPAQAVSDAVAVLVGQARGAGRPREALAAVRLGARDVAVFTSALGVLFLAVPQVLVAPFGASDEVLALVRPVLVLWAVAQVVDGVAQVLFGAINGSGDTRYAFVVTTVGAWGVKLPIAAALVLGWHGGVLGAWAAIAVECAWQLAATAWRLRGVGWLVRERRTALATA